MENKHQENLLKSILQTGQIKLTAKLDNKEFKEVLDLIAKQSIITLKLECFAAILPDNQLKQILESLKPSKSLKTLNLYAQQFTDETILALAELVTYTKTLESLNLRHCNINDEQGLLLAQAISENNNLTYVNLAYNFNKKTAEIIVEIINSENKLTKIECGAYKDSPGAIDSNGYIKICDALMKSNSRICNIEQEAVEISSKFRDYGNNLRFDIYDNLSISNITVPFNKIRLKRELAERLIEVDSKIIKLLDGNNNATLAINDKTFVLNMVLFTPHKFEYLQSKEIMETKDHLGLIKGKRRIYYDEEMLEIISRFIKMSRQIQVEKALPGKGSNFFANYLLLKYEDSQSFRVLGMWNNTDEQMQETNNPLAKSPMQALQQQKDMFAQMSMARKGETEYMPHITTQPITLESIVNKFKDIINNRNQKIIQHMQDAEMLNPQTGDIKLILGFFQQTCRRQSKDNQLPALLSTMSVQSFKTLLEDYGVQKNDVQSFVAVVKLTKGEKLSLAEMFLIPRASDADIKNFIDNLKIKVFDQFKAEHYHELAELLQEPDPNKKLGDESSWLVIELLTAFPFLYNELFENRFSAANLDDYKQNYDEAVLGCQNKKQENTSSAINPLDAKQNNVAKDNDLS